MRQILTILTIVSTISVYVDAVTFRPTAGTPWKKDDDENPDDIIQHQETDDNFSENNEVKTTLESVKESEEQSLIEATSNNFENQEGGNTKPSVSLSSQEAKTRKKQISNVVYHMDFALLAGDKFLGKAMITFQMESANDTQGLFLDYMGSKIHSLMINGKPSDPKLAFDGMRIKLDSSLLKAGQQNTVTLNFLNSYRSDGNGLHSFTDHTDNKQYLFTHFEVDHCRMVMPVFDQPDLKAPLILNTITPKYWSVIANERDRTNTQQEADDLMSSFVQIAQVFETGVDALKSDQYKCMFFKKGPEISTYLYAIVAGPYAVKEYKNQPNDGTVPMRVYARESLIKYVNQDDIFKAVIHGMKFYKDLFGKPYAFSKYDQVFVPELNFGGMENVALITFNERLLHRDEVITINKKMDQNMVVLHELAHQWFGNLVTMKWWSDLWLNESFATYMSYMALSELKGPEDFSTVAWLGFLESKFGGIQDDSLETTHPVCSEISNAEQADSAFDGISYGKGASYLKQVHSIFGQETLKNALHIYFTKYSWKNTEFADFISSLQEAYDKQHDGSKVMGKNFDIMEWSNTWLKTSGVNLLEGNAQYGKNNTLEKFQIKQIVNTKVGHSRLRKQKLSVVFYELKDDKFVEHYVNNIVLSDTQELNEIKINITQPIKAYQINYGDTTYAKVRFSPETLEQFKLNLNKVTNPLSRAMFWFQLWYHIYDGVITSSDFIDISVAQLPHEKTPESLKKTLQNLSVATRLYSPPQLIELQYSKVFNMLYGMLYSNKTEVTAKEEVFDKILDFVNLKSDVDKVTTWLDGKTPPGIEISPDNKKSILIKICSNADYGKDYKNSMMQKVLGDDQSDMAIRSRMKCEAAMPIKDQKLKIWRELTGINEKNSNAQVSSFSDQELTAKSEGLYQWNQQDVLEPLFDDYLKVIGDKRFYGTHGYKYTRQFVNTLLPTNRDITQQHVDQFRAVKDSLQTDPEVPSYYHKVLSNAFEEFENIVKLRTAAQKQMQSLHQKSK